jgi:hypothetical protein
MNLALTGVNVNPSFVIVIVVLVMMFATVPKKVYTVAFVVLKRIYNLGPAPR